MAMIMPSGDARSVGQANAIAVLRPNLSEEDLPEALGHHGTEYHRRGHVTSADAYA